MFTPEYLNILQNGFIETWEGHPGDYTPDMKNLIQKYMELYRNILNKYVDDYPIYPDAYKKFIDAVIITLANVEKKINKIVYETHWQGDNRPHRHSNWSDVSQECVKCLYDTLRGMIGIKTTYMLLYFRQHAQGQCERIYDQEHLVQETFGSIFEQSFIKSPVTDSRRFGRVGINF